MGNASAHKTSPINWIWMDIWHLDRISTFIGGVDNSMDGTIYSSTCNAYVNIKEEQFSTTTTLCAGKTLGSRVYTSTSSTVQISFVQTDMDEEKYFFIEFQG